MPEKKRGPWLWKARKGWYVKVDRKNVRLASEEEGQGAAVAAWHRLMVREGRLPAKDTLAARDVFNAFLEDRMNQVERGVMARVTYDGYRRFLKLAAKSFGQLGASEVRPLHVNRWLDSQKDWGDTTRFNAITAVKASYRWAKRQGLAAENPVADMDRPQPKLRKVVPTDAEVKGVLARVKDRAFRDLVVLLHETGARPGELTRAEAADVTTDANGTPQAIVLREHKTARKTGEARSIYLGHEAAGIVARLMADHPAGPLLLNRSGNPWTRHAIALRLGRLKAGWTAYSLRHKWITDHLESGTPIATVAELAGHRDTTMISRVYNRLSQRRQHLSDAARRLNRPGEAKGE